MTLITLITALIQNNAFRQRFHGLLIVAFLHCGTGISASEQSFAGRFLKFDHDGLERKYLLYLPSSLSENAPLVFLLHGYRGNARENTELGMNRLADLHGFAVCYPQGEKDVRGTTHWNAKLKISDVDDIGFLASLAIHLQQQHRLNPEKTFAWGISNGGFMSYALVAERPDVFKAAASVIGTMSGDTWKQRKQIHPVSILQISGLEDRVVPYDGSMSPRGGWGGAPSQDEMIRFWAELNEAKEHEVIQVSNRTTAHYYRNGINNNEVWHYQIARFGHRIPRQRNAAIDLVAVIWEFFSRR